mmetsp:Transcript_32806/g.51163  ORF Transcript_32806/g.51163 Transcript_32806/m.51163 type:complete len:99 (-) Transcript_32806:48-344(-)
MLSAESRWHMHDGMRQSYRFCNFNLLSSSSLSSLTFLQFPEHPQLTSIRHPDSFTPLLLQSLASPPLLNPHASKLPLTHTKALNRFPCGVPFMHNPIV